MSTRHDAFIGRWVVFHKGHLEIIRKVFSKNNRPILILIMNTEESPSASIRAKRIEEVLCSENIVHQLCIIPPIASINWGRTVGYETNYIQVDEEIQNISGTHIREKMANNDKSWKDDVPQ